MYVSNSLEHKIKTDSNSPEPKIQEVPCQRKAIFTTVCKIIKLVATQKFNSTDRISEGRRFCFFSTFSVATFFQKYFEFSAEKPSL